MNPDLNYEYALLLPEFILAATAALVLFADAFRQELRVSRRLLPWLAVLGALVAGVVSLAYLDRSDDFAELLTIDDFTTFFRVLFAAIVVVLILGSHEFVERHVRHVGEFYALLLLATVGAIFMSAARELITAYIAIELLSFSLYVAVSLTLGDRRSGEASLKYVLLGGVASAMLLYGLSLLYGIAGSTQYAEIGAAFAAGTADFEWALVLSLALLIGGLGFKASAVPFHMWTPDAYEGAPLPITAFLSATSKAAIVALLLRVFGGPLLPAIDEWQWMMATLAVLTMAFGNLIALQQSNIKRLLAYSSIGQVGYMLMAVTAISFETSSALLLHVAGYLVTNLAVFAAVIAVHNRTGDERIAGFRGLAETQPYLALVLTAGLFSLAGMPLFAGFATKFILFQAVASEGFLWLSVVAVIASTVSLYYYLQVIRQMYLYPPDGDAARWRPSFTALATTGGLLLGVVFIGLYAGPLFRLADGAATALFV
ncbi:MAG: NADH-quinone oxidoreductase subunit N [Chloroflexi bacterium]|nr:NADH-quinone oxidoreductase subunit N [Chloroflexota bacterium]